MNPVTAMAAVVSLVTHAAVMGTLLVWPADDPGHAVRLIDIEVSAATAVSAPGTTPEDTTKPESVSASPARRKPTAVARLAAPPPPAEPDNPITRPAKAPKLPTIEVVRLSTAAPDPTRRTPATATRAAPSSTPNVEMPVIAARPENTAPHRLRPETAAASSSQASPSVVIKTPTTSAPRNPQPRYPLIARKRGFEGRSIIRAHISPSGQVLKVEIAQSSGYPVLDVAARDAVSGWQFQPAKREGRAITGLIDVPIEFRLR
jgi:periplasmic protein TonB